MKKFAAIVSAFLLAVGLTALVAPADAATGYPGSVRTYCHVNFKQDVIRHGHEDKVRFSVTTSGTGRPRGSVRVVTTSKRHTYAKSYRYSGGSTYHWFPKMKRGRYSVHMHFSSSRASYKNCGKTGHSVRVR